MLINFVTRLTRLPFLFLIKLIVSLNSVDNIGGKVNVKVPVILIIESIFRFSLDLTGLMIRVSA